MKSEIKVEDEIADMVGDFLKNRNADLETLQSLLEKDDLPEIKKICHKIKGIARPYGFPTLENLSIQMESACADHKKTEVDRLMKEVKTYLSQYS